MARKRLPFLSPKEKMRENKGKEEANKTSKKVFRPGEGGQKEGKHGEKASKTI